MTVSGDPPRMVRLLPLLLLFGAGCHGEFAPKTTEEDKAINNFAEARLRGATFYQGGDYVRAAEQYRKALEYRPQNGACLLGYGYSLMKTDVPSQLVEARKQFEAMKPFMDKDQEVKRIHGLGLTHRALAIHFQARGRIRAKEGKVKEGEQDFATARAHARDGIGCFETILAREDRTSLSLRPDAHIGAAHCQVLLADATNKEPFEKALAHIQAFSDIAEKARRHWSEGRERILSTDPLQDDPQGDAKATEKRAADLQRAAAYEVALVALTPREVAVRKALVETYFYLNRIEDGIKELDTIEKLAPDDGDVYYYRGRAYAFLSPPDYVAALRDLNKYRTMKAGGSLTEEMIQLNRLIRTYEEKLRQQTSAGG
jgi:tetratricopeptide (TPR) repeat protein